VDTVNAPTGIPDAKGSWIIMSVMKMITKTGCKETAEKLVDSAR